MQFHHNKIINNIQSENCIDKKRITLFDCTLYFYQEPATMTHSLLQTSNLSPPFNETINLYVMSCSHTSGVQHRFSQRLSSNYSFSAPVNKTWEPINSLKNLKTWKNEKLQIITLSNFCSNWSIFVSTFSMHDLK